MNYEMDAEGLRGPEELGGEGGVPADWCVWLVGTQENFPNHHMIVQFASVGVDRNQARILIARILRGLNDEVPG